MTFPAGVTLCEVTLPASSVWQGGASSIQLTLTPTRSLIHRASNTPLEPVTGSSTGPSGPGVVLSVPHGDQPGYRDAVGNSISTWEYDVVAVYRDAANVEQTLRKQIRIPRTSSSINVLTAIDYEPTVAKSYELDKAAKALIANPGSETAAALNATFVRFVDLAGNPITARHVTIKVDTSTWEIADIIAEA